MAIFITQARFARDGLKGMIAAPEDASETVGRLIAQVGGKLIACYLTSGDYDILLIFEAPSYEDAVSALIVAAAENGVADLKTVTALTSSEIKNALVKAGAIAANDRSTGVAAAGLSFSERKTDSSNSDPERTETAEIVEILRKSNLGASCSRSGDPAGKTMRLTMRLHPDGLRAWERDARRAEPAIYGTGRTARWPQSASAGLDQSAHPKRTAADREGSTDVPGHDDGARTEMERQQWLGI
jgi:uncharacterized protein with GYD domain